MNLTQLQYVKAVADSGSFTKAALLCFVTQPTLSNGIAQLEQELGERIFTRTTRSVKLTEFGQHIQPYLDVLLRAHSQLLERIKDYPHAVRQFIRIGVSPLIKAAWLSSAIGDFRKHNPGVEIVLHEQNMAELYHMLDQGKLDFVFGVAGHNKAAWRSAFLYEEPLFFIPRGKTAKPVKKTKTISEIADETYVMVPNVCGLASVTRNLFRSQRRKLKEYSGEALSYQILEQWAMLGLGAAILPKSKMSLAARNALALVNKAGEPVFITFEAVWLGGEKKAKHMEMFIAQIAKAGAYSGLT